MKNIYSIRRILVCILLKHNSYYNKAMKNNIVRNLLSFNQHTQLNHNSTLQQKVATSSERGVIFT
jgi:hypothetical protein